MYGWLIIIIDLCVWWLADWLMPDRLIGMCVCVCQRLPRFSWWLRQTLSQKSEKSLDFKVRDCFNRLLLSYFSRSIFVTRMPGDEVSLQILKLVFCFDFAAVLEARGLPSQFLSSFTSRMNQLSERAASTAATGITISIYDTCPCHWYCVYCYRCSRSSVVLVFMIISSFLLHFFRFCYQICLLWIAFSFVTIEHALSYLN